MHLEKALSQVAAITPERFDDVRRHIYPEWVEQALRTTGAATLRKRRCLPAEQVIWLVIAMALFRNRSIVEIVDKLDLALPGPFPTVAKSAVSQARGRLGAEPLSWLFERSAEHWAHASAASDRWRSLALYGVDGSTLRVADSDENRAYFGGSKSQRGESGYPLARMVGLMALRSHLMAAAAFGPYQTGEYGYASTLWSAVPDNSLTIVDRGFFGAGVLIPLARGGNDRHWLTRGKKNLRSRELKRFDRRDALVEMNVSSAARAKNSTLPKVWVARAITYQRKGFRPQLLLTSLLDAEKYPAEELIALYHERWELGLGYDEIKTEMLDREESLRSKSPDGGERWQRDGVQARCLVEVDIAGHGLEQGQRDRQAVLGLMNIDPCARHAVGVRIGVGLGGDHRR